ncbi:MAG: hypothetical protein OXI33_00615, partial [Chloroflexota bacterium]|nr:hypothetical protein [Chloroflexota bacterium]
LSFSFCAAVVPHWTVRAASAKSRGARLGEFWKYWTVDYRVSAHIKDHAFRMLVVRGGRRVKVYRQG